MRQEVFVRVLAASPRYTPSASFAPFLHRIVINLCRDLWRSRRDTESLSEEPVVVDGGPEQVAVARELREIVEAAIDRLPARQREVVVLKHYGQLTFQQIADATGAPPSTVKSRLHAALTRLEGDLAQHGIRRDIESQK